MFLGESCPPCIATCYYPGCDVATYTIQFGDSVTFGAPVGRPTFSARMARRPGGYLGKAIPSSSDGLLDSLSTRYGSMIRVTYTVAAVKFVGDDLQVAGLLGASVRVVVAAGVCPLPARRPTARRHSTLASVCRSKSDTESGILRHLCPRIRCIVAAASLGAGDGDARTLEGS